MEKTTEKMARIALEDAERAHEIRESLDKAQSAIRSHQCVHRVWNHDISAAPRGKMVPYTRKGKDGPVQSEQYRKEYILAVDEHGVVSQSYWIPPRYTQSGGLLEGNRWSGFNPGVDPIAWAPWPEYEFAAATTSEAALTPAPMNVSLPDTDERSGEGANAGECPDEKLIRTSHPQTQAGELVSNSSARILEDVGGGA